MQTRILGKAWNPLAAPVLLALALSVHSVSAADGNPPERMAYQGVLTDVNGNVLGATNTGPRNYDVVFRIWSDQTSGTKLWTEQQTVTVDKGYFSVLLGEGSSYQSEPRPLLLSTVFTNETASDRFIEITVKGIGAGSPPADVTLAPRMRLLTSPYSFLSKTAVNAQNIVNGGGLPVITVTGVNVGIDKQVANTALDVNGTVTATGLNINGGASVSGSISSAGLSSTGPVSGTTFTGSGSGLTSLPAGNLTGTVPDARLSGNVATLSANQTFSGSATFNGPVRMGSSYPAIGDESLRMIRGTVNSDGSVAAGGGFSCSKTTQIIVFFPLTTYTINFGSSFSGAPTPIISIPLTEWPTAVQTNLAFQVYNYSVNNNSATLTFFPSIPNKFHFLFIGPR